MRPYAFTFVSAFIVGSTMSASTSLAQGSEDRPRGDTFSMPSLSFDDYARSRGIAPLRQFRRTPNLDSARLQLKASLDSTRMRLLAMRAAPRFVCPMPVARNDTAVVAPMPSLVNESKGEAYGQLIGCENPLNPNR